MGGRLRALAAARIDVPAIGVERNVTRHALAPRDGALRHFGIEQGENA